TYAPLVCARPRPPPASTLFPYTTLFRSARGRPGCRASRPRRPRRRASSARPGCPPSDRIYGDGGQGADARRRVDLRGLPLRERLPAALDPDAILARLGRAVRVVVRARQLVIPRAGAGRGER